MVKVKVEVTEEVPPIVMGLGLRLQVGAFAPLTIGEMPHERVMAPVYPPDGVTVTVAVDELPGAIVIGFAAPAESEKLGAIGTTVAASTTTSRLAGNINV